MIAPANATNSTIEVTDVDVTPSTHPSPIEVPSTPLVTLPATSAATSAEVASLGFLEFIDHLVGDYKW